MSLLSSYPNLYFPFLKVWEERNALRNLILYAFYMYSSQQIFSSISFIPGLLKEERKSPEEIEWFLEDLFLGSQWSIILGYRRLSVKFLSFASSLSFLVCKRSNLQDIGSMLIYKRLSTRSYHRLQSISSSISFVYRK